MDITAMCILINLTVCFNGGMKHTYTILYQTEGSYTPYTANVNTDPGVNKGDIVTYDLINSSNPATFIALIKLCII
jgi:hypothetical protein